MKKKKQKGVYTAFMYATPKNIEEQRVRFFDNNCKVNPQFEYTNYELAQRFVAQFKEPSYEHFDLAKRILDSFIDYYGNESNYLETEGDIVGRDETMEIFTNYVEDLDF